MKKIKILGFTIVLILCVATLVISYSNQSNMIQYASLLSAVLGVVLLAAEIYQSRKITEADFIADLNTSFVTNEDYKHAYTLFEEYDFENLPDLELKNIYISNYLTFFETFQLLIDRGTLTIDMLDDLFGYRFFIAMHNPYVQKKKLVKSPENFRNLYRLEKEWSDYRRKTGRPIFHEEYSLEKMVDPETYKKMTLQKKKGFKRLKK